MLPLRMDDPMRNAKRMKTVLWAIVLIALALYGWSARGRMPCLLGQASQVQFGTHTVRMASCWYPYAGNRAGTSMSFVQDRLDPRVNNGHISMLVMPDLSADFRDLIQKSPVLKKYEWGTAVRLDPSWIYVLMKTRPSEEFAKDSAANEGITVFIPEKSMLIDAIRPSDLDSIISIEAARAAAPVPR